LPPARSSACSATPSITRAMRQLTACPVNNPGAGWVDRADREDQHEAFV
jgi:hypothetical protein